MKKYEYWAWINAYGNVISPRFSSKAKAIEWKKKKNFISGYYSLFAKIREEELDCNKEKQ